MRTLATWLYAASLLADLVGAGLVIADVVSAQRVLRRYLEAGPADGDGVSWGQTALLTVAVRAALGSGRRRGIGAGLLILGAGLGAAGNFCALAVGN